MWGNVWGLGEHHTCSLIRLAAEAVAQESRSVWMQTRMEDLMKERDEAAEAHALMELEWREANRSAREANEK
eukprot:SAG11_NODE_17843_length_507_cov_1.382353_1_plen_72_part_00